MTDKLDKVREIWDKILKSECKAQIACPYNFDCENHPDCFARELDQILNTPITIEGGVCPRCEGSGGYFPKDRVKRPTTIDCPTCKGTGKLAKTIKQLIEEAMG